jgi:hypothetical protein
VIKRIEDLKGKALDQAVPYTWHHLNQVQIDDVLNKFAELIVQQCIDKAERYGLGSDAVEQMKEDFGVE